MRTLFFILPFIFITTGCIKQNTEKSDILNDYIIPEYEILHTQGKEYIVDDIIEVMEERGVKI